MTGLFNSTADMDFTTTNPINSSSAYVFQLPFDESSIIIFASILSVCFIFGLAANIITIVVILKTPKLRDVFNTFILSLCVSDIISILVSPINLYRRTWGFEDFQLPNFFCVLYWGGDIWTSYVTAQHIASFAILRYICIKNPIQFKKIKVVHCNIYICCIWIVSFCCGFIPMSVWRGKSIIDRTLQNNPTTRWPSCTQFYVSLHQYKLYSYYGFAIFLYIPLIIVVVVSVIIAIVISHRLKLPIQQSNSSNAKKEKQAMLQLSLIVGSFLLGYVPFTAFEFYTINTTDKSPEALIYLWWLGTGAYIMLRFSETLNPFFYNIGSTKMRRATLNFLRDLQRTGTPKFDKKSKSFTNISSVSTVQK